MNNSVHAPKVATFERFRRDRGLLEGYSEVTVHSEALGYVEMLAMSTGRKKIYHMHQHHLMKTEKPGKPRVAPDCAAGFQRTLLNGRPLQGPHRALIMSKAVSF